MKGIFLLQSSKRSTQMYGGATVTTQRTQCVLLYPLLPPATWWILLYCNNRGSLSQLTWHVRKIYCHSESSMITDCPPYRLRLPVTYALFLFSVFPDMMFLQNPLLCDHNDSIMSDKRSCTLWWNKCVTGGTRVTRCFTLVEQTWYSEQAECVHKIR